MNILALLRVAKDIGPQAVWPVLFVALVAFSLNQIVKYRAENQKLIKDRIKDRLNAITAANNLLKKLDPSSMSDSEFLSVKTAVLQIAGITIQPQVDQVVPAVTLSSGSVDLYNEFNAHAIYVSAMMAVVYYPVAVVLYAISGWRPSIHLRVGPEGSCAA